MTESVSTASGEKIVSDAAALSLIDIRRIDRAAGKSAKRGDLTDKLKRRPNGEAGPAPAPVTVMSNTAPVAAPPMVPAPSLPPPAALAAEPAPPPVTRRAVALPEPYVAPEPEAKPPPPPTPAPEVRRAAPLPYDDLRSADDLIYYWDELRAGRALPLFASLDRTRIAISWPDTVMVNYGPDQAAMPQIARLSRLTGAVEFTSMVTEWVLSCSRQVARIGKAMETKRVFAGAQNPRSYHLLLLPFANSGGTSDHVLCHLSCAD